MKINWFTIFSSLDIFSIEPTPIHRQMYTKYLGNPALLGNQTFAMKVNRRPNLKNLGRGLNPPKPGLNWAPAWNIWYNFKWIQPYLNRGLNSFNSATA